MTTYRKNLAILDASPKLIRIDAGSPFCLMEAVSMGCNRHWEIIRQKGQPMTAYRLLGLMAYTLRRGLQANFAKPSTVWEPIPDEEFERMGKVELPTPIMISNTLLSLALETRRGKCLLRRYHDIAWCMALFLEFYGKVLQLGANDASCPGLQI